MISFLITYHFFDILQPLPYRFCLHPSSQREPLKFACAAANGKSSVRLALESNDANKTSKPTTFVDLAETIWRLLGEDKTQQQVANELGGIVHKLRVMQRFRSLTNEPGTSL